MSLDRQHGKIIFTCDDCNDDLETDTRDFDKAREELRAAGWHIMKEDEEWLHFCGHCYVGE